MFNCLPGAMLQKGHTHQWKKGFSCSRVPSQHNARTTASHRLFNPGRPGGKASNCHRSLAARQAAVPSGGLVVVSDNVAANNRNRPGRAAGDHTSPPFKHAIEITHPDDCSPSPTGR